jgi:hypothetical protein
MKLTKDQFLEAGFIFEKANGNSHSDYEKGIIAESELTNYKPKELEQILVNGLNSEIYKNDEDRISAYWALSKNNNRDLILEFQKWLRTELNIENGIAIFQILVALDRFDEPAFHKNRNSRGNDETELNIRDANQYLNKKNSTQDRL